MNEQKLGLFFSLIAEGRGRSKGGFHPENETVLKRACWKVDAYYKACKNKSPLV